MKLTDKQSQILRVHLERHMRSCPVCGSNNISVGDRIFELREFQGGDLIIGGQSSILPVVAATCPQCGHIHFFSAILLGLISRNIKEDGKTKK